MSLHICRLPHTTTPFFSIWSRRPGACLLQFQQQSDHCVHCHSSLINCFPLAALVKLNFNRAYWGSVALVAAIWFRCRLPWRLCVYSPSGGREVGCCCQHCPLRPYTYVQLWPICSACYPLMQTLSKPMETINLQCKSVVLLGTASTHIAEVALLWMPIDYGSFN